MVKLNTSVACRRAEYDIMYAEVSAVEFYPLVIGKSKLIEVMNADGKGADFDPTAYWKLYFYPFYIYTVKLIYSKPFGLNSDRMVHFAVDAVTGLVFSVPNKAEGSENCDYEDVAVLKPVILPEEAVPRGISNLKMQNNFGRKRNVFLSMRKKTIHVISCKLLYKPFWVNENALQVTKSAKSVIDATNGDIGGIQCYRIARGILKGMTK